MFTQKKLALLAVLIAVGGLGACRDPAPDINGVDKATVSGPGGVDSKVNRDNFVVPPTWTEAVGSDRVFFDVDKSVVRTEGREVLVRWAAYLKRNPSNRLVIEGHSDERGTREYNLALGDRRANAVKDVLVVNGIAMDRIKTVSYGKERPAVLGSEESSYAQNRRAVGILM